MAPFVVACCLFGIFCLTPLALYLTWLGTLNRRQRPTVIAGAWDFAALLAGLSGFLVFGGGVIVGGLQSNARIASRGNWEQIQAAWGEEQHAWGAIALGYVLVLLGVITLAVIARLRTLSVYNIDRKSCEAAIDASLAEAGVSATRFGNLWSDGRGLIELIDVPGFRHITLKLKCPDVQLRDELERNLRMRLWDVASGDNPAASWLYSASAGCLMFMLCCLFVIGYLIYMR